MLKKRLGLAVAVAAAGASALLLAPAAQAVTAGVIHVPSDFVKSLSDTRANGHLEVTPDGLRIWTDGSTDTTSDGKTNTDKVAEYVTTSTALQDVKEASLDYQSISGSTAPGFQLVVDLNADGTPDGILVGEDAYNQRWWLGKPWTTIDLSTAPGAADGYAHSGTLGSWNAAYPYAKVAAFGFSLGSGVEGQGILKAIDFAGTRYTFAKDVILHGKDECKNGGWAKSTVPTYSNQGECVSHFASTKHMQAVAG